MADPHYAAHIKVLNAATKNNGRLGWRFHQNMPECRPIVGRGVCWAISLEYLKLIRRGFDPGQYYGAYMSIRNGRSVYRGVNIDALMTLVAANRALNEDENYFDFQLQSQNDFIVLSRQGDVDLNPVEVLAHADRMANGTINRNMMVYIDGENGGHAMAYRLFNNRVRFFDPNFGEYLFNSPASFMDFFTYFLPAMYEDDYDTFSYADLSA
ncbi:YopT-type cysteine protease domain-containing protein [Microbulbifer harenosus]|uniref:Peptidase C58 YopT-type domain-containing protein n=1 Tax=Microbulbifer harenosus TaxID=2576840 RepID=A0ABY2UJY3_9GAMM|nr:MULTISPECIES: YopT-type cysteine protease domain-containing protein [Microbulbifer]QIL89278.1 hypothetical protein GNX18_05490 [Microbulbifer sp. SH-1]TLM78579.1 hypothetical protein FDY93_04740 [Microbulbifer harenosus]